MLVNEIELNQELRQILWACYKCWQSEEMLPPDDRDICYSWVVKVYVDKFDAIFLKAKLHHLAKLGFLKPVGEVRKGSRRYFLIVNPDRLDELLKSWNMQ